MSFRPKSHIPISYLVVMSKNSFRNSAEIVEEITSSPRCHCDYSQPFWITWDRGRLERTQMWSRRVASRGTWLIFYSPRIENLPITCLNQEYSVSECKSTHRMSFSDSRCDIKTLLESYLDSVLAASKAKVQHDLAQISMNTILFLPRKQLPQF